MERRGTPLAIRITVVTVNALRFGFRRLLFAVAIMCVFSFLVHTLVNSLYAAFGAAYFFVLIVSLIVEWCCETNSNGAVPFSAHEVFLWQLPRFVCTAALPILALILAENSYEYPTPLCPGSLLLLLGISWNSAGLILLPISSFTILTFGIKPASKASQLPLRFPVALILTAFCTVLWFGTFAKDAIPLYGDSYVVGVAILNVVWILVLWCLWKWVHVRASISSTLIWAMLFQLWILWCAFPILIDTNEIAEMIIR